MHVNRHGIVSLIAADGNSTLACRFASDLEPVFRIVEKDSFPLVHKSAINENDIAATIARATGELVSGVLPVSASGEMLNTNCGHENDYASHVPLALMRTRRAAFRTTHGAYALDHLVEPLWDLFAREYVATVQRSHASFLSGIDWTLAADIAYGPALCMAYAAGYAFVGDVAGYTEMRGILHLASQVLPIGSPRGSDDLWLVLVE